MAETCALTVSQLCCKAWRETRAVQNVSLKQLLYECTCSHNQNWTHRAVCMPEAATVMSDYAGRPEDNVVFSLELDGNTSVCPLHPGECTQGTRSAVFLHLRHRTYSICMKTLSMQTQPVHNCFIFVISVPCNFLVILYNSYHSISPFHHSYVIL